MTHPLAAMRSSHVLPCILRVFRGQIWYIELTGQLLSPGTPRKTEGLSSNSAFQAHRLCIVLVVLPC